MYTDINQIFKLSDSDIDYDGPITLIIQYDDLETLSGQILADTDLKRMAQYLVPFGEIQGEFPMSRVIVFTDNSTMMFTTTRPHPYMSPNYDGSRNVFYMKGVHFSNLWMEYTHSRSLTAEHIPFVDYFKDRVRRGYVARGNQ